MWAEYRMVRKDATIKLFGGAYETDPALAGRKVECVFDPFDLTVVEVRWNGRPCGPGPPAAASAGTPIPRPSRRIPPRRRRPGSTTWASSPPSMSRPPAATASATTPSPRAAGRPGRQAGGRAVTGQPVAARRDQRPDRLGRAAIAAPARQRRPRRDRRLPGRQGRPAGPHRRQPRRKTAGPAEDIDSRPRSRGRARAAADAAARAAAAAHHPED